MGNVLMKCGHIAQGIDKDTGKPYCVICNCSEIADKDIVNLEGRTAKCDFCGYEKPSSFNLPFFEYTPDKPHDSYFCGCIGWD